MLGVTEMVGDTAGPEADGDTEIVGLGLGVTAGPEVVGLGLGETTGPDADGETDIVGDGVGET